MATAAVAIGEWTDRLIGPCPVSPRTRVQVQFRGEGREEAERAQEPEGMPADRFVWAIEHHKGDIVAYRVVG